MILKKSKWHIIEIEGNDVPEEEQFKVQFKLVSTKKYHKLLNLISEDDPSVENVQSDLGKVADKFEASERTLSFIADNILAWKNLSDEIDEKEILFTKEELLDSPVGFQNAIIINFIKVNSAGFLEKSSPNTKDVSTTESPAKIVQNSKESSEAVEQMVT